MSVLLLSVTYNRKGCMIPFKPDSDLAFIYYRAKKVWSEVDVETHMFSYLVEDSATDMAEFSLYDKTDVVGMYLYTRNTNKNILKLHLRRRVIPGSSSSTPQNQIPKRAENDDKVLESSYGSQANIGTSSHPKADSNLIANIVKGKLKDELDNHISLRKDINMEYGLEVNYKKAWRGKETAMSAIHDADDDSYDRLRWYCRALQKYNSGSVAKYEDDFYDKKFRRVFIGLGPCMAGFMHACRPLIFLDGTHGKNKCKGTLLSAVGKDANDGLLPIAYAVVGAENDDNWYWFCANLRIAFREMGLECDEGFTFFTNRNASLIKALRRTFPDPVRSYCLRHQVDNFKKQVMQHYPITDTLPLFAPIYAESDVINNNQAECWNSWVLEARLLPLVPMMQHIHRQIMVMMRDRREEGGRMTGLLCPKPEQQLSARHKESRMLHLRIAGHGTYEVSDPNTNQTFAVDVPRLTCSCGVWQIERMPCSHACACIKSFGRSLYEYVDPYFNCEMYRVAYEKTFAPIPTFEDDVTQSDDDEKIHPLDARTPPDRRRTKRIPSQVIMRRKTCSQCKKQGHDKRTCKQPVQS